jgi:hypothetical protein
MKPKSRKTLVKNANFTDQQLKDFILEIVNAADHLVDGSDDCLAQQYRQFFPTRDRDIQVLATELSHYEDPNHPDPNNPFNRKEAIRMLCRSVMGELRKNLRMVWHAGNENAAEWRIFQLQARIHDRTNFEERKRNLHPPSPDTPIELAIDWVRRNLLALHVCRNPGCRSPFFVANRGQQQFCLQCVSDSQKAHKRRWYRENKGLEQESKMNAGAKIEPAKRSARASPESERKWKQFLHDIVNAQENNFDYILKVYAEAGFLPLKTLIEQVAALHLEFPISDEDLRSKRRQERHRIVKWLREGLRRIWSADDQYTGRWRVFTLQNSLWSSADPKYDLGESLQPAPPSDQLLHQAFDYLRRNLHMLRTCANPTCQTPLFIASKAGQVYCSDLCAAHAQSEYKSRWWREKGSDWRKARKAKPKKSRRVLRRSQ